MSNPNKINIGHFGTHHEEEKKKKGLFGGLFSKKHKEEKDSTPTSPSSPSPTSPSPVSPPTQPVQAPSLPVVQQIKPVSKPFEAPKAPVAPIQPQSEEIVMQETPIPPRQPFVPAAPVQETVMQELSVPPRPQFYSPPIYNEVVMNELPPPPPRPTQNEVTMNEIPAPKGPGAYGNNYNSGYGNQYPNNEVFMNELPVPPKPSPYANSYDTVMNELPAPPPPTTALDDEFSKHLKNLSSTLSNIQTGVDEWKHIVPTHETTTTTIKSTSYGTAFNVTKARKEDALNLESVEVYMQRYGYEKMKDAAVHWMYELTQDHHLVSKSFEEAMQSGVILAKVINVIKPNFVTINNTGTQAAKRDTVNNVISSIKRLGILDSQNFKPNDMLDGNDSKQVVLCIHAINRYALLLTGFDGPFITDDIEEVQSIHKTGPKKNWSNPNAAVPLFEATANKGANQKLDVVRETAHYTGSYGPGETRVVETETVTEVTEFHKAAGGHLKQVGHTKTVVKEDPPVHK